MAGEDEEAVVTFIANWLRILGERDIIPGAVGAQLDGEVWSELRADLYHSVIDEAVRSLGAREEMRGSFEEYSALEVGYATGALEVLLGLTPVVTDS